MVVQTTIWYGRGRKREVHRGIIGTDPTFSPRCRQMTLLKMLWPGSDDFGIGPSNIRNQRFRSEQVNRRLSYAMIDERLPMEDWILFRVAGPDR